jgi:UDP:flavonoid glycosyltransferase YjiC (YdhE family)
MDGSLYLFVAINGAGLGHLTRCLAIARQLRRLDPDSRIIFYSTSIGVPIVHQFGYACYHLPPADVLRDEGVGPRQWNEMYARQMTAIMKLHRPATVLFDGSFPYAGLREVMHDFRQVRWVWVHRGLNREKQGVSERLESFSRSFDLVVEPGEVGSELDPGEIKSGRRVRPVVLLDPEEILSREDAMRALALHPDRPAAYVQLGAGNINEIDDLQNAVVDALKEMPQMQVVLGHSPISTSARKPGAADRVLVDFPNARYFAAFDVGVVAAGYNTVSEAYAYGLPAVLLPNNETSSDDQQKRAERLVALGDRWAVLTGWSRAEFRFRLEGVLNVERGNRLDRFAHLDEVDGAASIAARVSSLARAQ